MRRIAPIVALILICFTALAQTASYFNQGFLRQPSAAADRAYLGITNSGGMGPPGPPGPPGPAGPAGPTGPAGANGTSGTNGVSGTNGATGPQGIQGVAGINGTNGASGTNAAGGSNIAPGYNVNFKTNSGIITINATGGGGSTNGLDYPLIDNFGADSTGTNYVLDFNTPYQRFWFATNMVFRFSTNGPDYYDARYIYGYIPPTNYTRRIYLTDASTNWSYVGLVSPYTTLIPNNGAIIKAKYFGTGEGNVTFEWQSFSQQIFIPATPTFNPLSVAGCILWLNAAPGMVFTNADGTGPCTVSGQLVKTWNDNSGNNYNCTNVSSTLQWVPLGGPNGYGAVYNTTATYLQSANFGVTQAPPYCVFFVSKTSGALQIIDGKDSSHRLQVFFQSPNIDMSGDSSVFGGPWPPLNTWSYDTCYYAIGSQFIRTNGVLCASASDAGGSRPYGWTIFSSYAKGGNAVSAYIAEIIVYANSLNTNQINQVEVYLKSKYNL